MNYSALTDGSGNLSCSLRDVRIRLAEAGKLLGVELLDHLIIGDKSYISLRKIG